MHDFHSAFFIEFPLKLDKISFVFAKFKAWFSDTKKDFKEFAIRQMDVLIALVILWIGLYVGAHFLIVNSEAYNLTENFIETDPTITELVGDINSVSLQPMSNSIKWINSGGWANLELNTSGSKGHLKVRAYLEKFEGNWRLLKVHAILPNHDVVALKQ